jgi:toxin FitB
MIILDTNVVSELMRSEPAPQVANWVRDRDRRELRTTAITLAEIRYGIARLPDGRRKQILLTAADEIFSTFEDQVVPVDVAAAEHYAVIAGNRERVGKPITGFDALIAAVCRSRGAALATRNVADFDGTGVDIIDPWLQSSHGSSLQLRRAPARDPKRHMMGQRPDRMSSAARSRPSRSRTTSMRSQNSA